VDPSPLNEESPDLTLGTSVEPPLDEHEYDARIAVDPDEATAWCGKARCRLEQGDYIAAVEFAAAALARSLDTPDCSLLLIEAAARAGDRELLGLTMQRHIRHFPADGAEVIRHLVPSKLIALSSPNGTQNEADIAAFEQILCTVRDRRPRRYGQLLQCLLALRPRCILEIGVFNGRNAVDMIRAGGRTAHQAAQLRYIGFDLFEDMTLEVHEKEFSKYPLSRKKISDILSQYNQNHELIQGYTQDTLLEFHQSPYSRSVDFVFIDGGHSEETIESDWNNVAELMSSRTVVIFDDFYLDKARELDGLGCNSLVERLTQDRRYLVEMMPVSDSFDKDFGVLTVALVKVRLRPASSGSHGAPRTRGRGHCYPGGGTSKRPPEQAVE
jgi:predicted O-methyltransferase YrrM